MTKENQIGCDLTGSSYNLLKRHRPELRIDQLDMVSIINQRTTDTQESQGRKLLLGYPAANGGMRHVDEENTHEPTLKESLR